MTTLKVTNENITGNLTYHGILVPYFNYSVTHVNTSTYSVTSPIVGETNFYECDTTSTSITITLPLITSSTMIISVIDIGGNANIKNITIQTSGGNTICGQSSIIIDSPYNSLRFISNLTSSWYIA
jgi:hypothetical protein